MLLFTLSCNKSEDKIANVDFKDKIQISHTKQAGEQTLRVAIAAMVSPKDTAIYYDQMIRYIAKKLGRPVELIQRKTYREINDLIEKKELDFAFVCSGPYVEGHEKFGLEIIAAPMLYGKSSYQAYFIVHKNSQINSLKDLRGRKFAFTDPNSNTGAIVPMYTLKTMGERPDSFFSSYIYTYSHDNSIKAVSKRIVDAASVDGLIWEYYNEKRPDFVKHTKVIYKSPFYGIPPFVVHPHTHPHFKQRLREILLSMHKDVEGNKILKELNIDRFLVPDDNDYDSIRQMRHFIRKAN